MGSGVRNRQWRGLLRVFLLSRIRQSEEAQGWLGQPYGLPQRRGRQDGTEAVYDYDFGSDAEGWTVGFADLPVGHDQSTFELDHGHRTLPDGLEGSGVYVQGHNRSDDLFMFLYKQVGGLRPNAAYAVSVSLEPPKTGGFQPPVWAIVRLAGIGAALAGLGLTALRRRPQR